LFFSISIESKETTNSSSLLTVYFTFSSLDPSCNETTASSRYLLRSKVPSFFKVNPLIVMAELFALTWNLAIS
jgi:hypothetical protein